MNWSLEVEDIEKKKSALVTILDTMDVPSSRKDLSRDLNVRWLNRNLRIENSNHPMIETAMELIVFLFRKQYLIKKAQ